jgi:hypothetical protein
VPVRPSDQRATPAQPQPSSTAPQKPDNTQRNNKTKDNAKDQDKDKDKDKQ